MGLYEFIHRWGRICLQCGCYRVRPSLFCQNCEESLCQRRQRKDLWWPHKSELIRGYAHFTWIPNQSRALSLLVEDLKGEHMKEAWNFWARQSLQGLTESAILKSGLKMKDGRAPILIPAPSSNFQKQDHAFVFAQKLGELTGWPMKSCLQKVSAGSQKHLDKKGRQAVKLVANEKISDDQPVIFVDDVVTTGATAKAAYLALGKPKNFFVIALAYRQS